MDDSQDKDASPTINTLDMNASKNKTTASRRIPTSLPPRITDDLVSSQTKSPTPTAAVIQEKAKGGTMLKAIRDRTASIKSILSLRNKNTRKRN